MNNQKLFSVPKSTDQPLQLPERAHYHKDERGLHVKCYHETRALLTDWRFWVGTMFSFPIEHFLYEKVWPFTFITNWLGL